MRQAVEPMPTITLTFALTLVASLTTFASSAHAVPLDAVMKDCEQKTIVMGRGEDGKMVKVGERIGGYCRGILERTFAVSATARFARKTRWFLRISCYP